MQRLTFFSTSWLRLMLKKMVLQGIAKRNEFAPPPPLCCLRIFRFALIVRHDDWRRDRRPSESGCSCFQCALGFEFEQSETLMLACAGQSRIAAVAMRGKLPAFRQTVPAEEAVEAE